MLYVIIDDQCYVKQVNFNFQLHVQADKVE